MLCEVRNLVVSRLEFGETKVRLNFKSTENRERFLDSSTHKDLENKYGVCALAVGHRQCILKLSYSNILKTRMVPLR